MQPGETIALVGPTGGGKSTIVNLLCRFYEPRGGHDPHRRPRLHATTRCTRSTARIGMVLQTPHLFSARSARTSATAGWTPRDEEIEEAAKVAGAHDFIVTLEKGYDEKVGEGGNLLSSGQKQLDQPGARRAGPAGDLHHGRGHSLAWTR